MKHAQAIMELAAINGQEWQSMDSAPKDGRSIRLLTSEGFELTASWQDGYMNSEGENCACWVADEDSKYPDDWSEGVCWESNEDEIMSQQPTHFQYLPTPPKKD